MKRHTILRRTLAATGAAVALALPLVGQAGTAGATEIAEASPSAAEPSPSATEVVTEADVTRQVEDTTPTDNWVLYTRAETPSTAATFVDGPTGAPLGDGSLQLTTDTSSEKVFLFNYDHVGTALNDVDNISYSTYRTAGTANQLASLNLQVDYNGPNVDGGFTTLVFEPVYNLDQASVTDNTWQSWTGTGGGVWWSTKEINGQCAGANTSCQTTWDQIVTNNPDATILGGVGINQGSGNAELIDNVDAFTFDTTTYDFENVSDTDNPTTKEDCKDGGYRNFTPAFKNQGQCVSFYAKK